jgi:pilus assembly protein Flp/PilA
MKAELVRYSRYGFKTLALCGKGGGNAMNRRGAVRQRGQGMVEYALILVLVSIVVIVILLTMGNQIQNVFSNVVAALG